jgi:transposase-like protein
MEGNIVSAEVRAAVVEEYRRGDKVQAIQERHGIARATIYWILEQAEVTPDRVKRGRRLVGDNQQLAQLYDLVPAQHARILALEGRLRDLGVTTDTDEPLPPGP